MNTNLFQRDIDSIFYEFNNLFSFFSGKQRRSTTALTGLKTVLSLKLTNPSTDAVYMISHNIGNLLPWNARLIGSDGYKTHFGCRGLHAQIAKLFLDNLQVEML